MVYRHDIAVLRVICVLIVVAYHAYLKTYFGFFSSDVSQQFYDIYANFNDSYLINLAMPIFVFISGILFGEQVCKNNIDIGKLIKKKAIRILVPYIVFSIIFFCTTSIGSPIDIIRGNYWHLWFLPMLFWCFPIGFVITPLLFNKRKGVRILTIIILFALVLKSNVFPDCFGLGMLNGWLCWFAIGMLTARYMPKSISLLNKLTISIIGGGVHTDLYSQNSNLRMEYGHGIM